jgi:hypothetical protein
MTTDFFTRSVDCGFSGSRVGRDATAPAPDSLPTPRLCAEGATPQSPSGNARESGGCVAKLVLSGETKSGAELGRGPAGGVFASTEEDPQIYRKI